jgi:hypothetical protein
MNSVRHCFSARMVICNSHQQEPLLRAPAGATRAEVKAAFRAQLLRLHPDVNKGREREAETETLLLLAEYRRALQRSSQSPVDAFSTPETLAELLFVNELRCLGRSCWSSCVGKAPATFAWSERTGAAYCTSGDSRDSEYAVTCAVGQCPNACIHVLTPLQLARLEGELERARSGEASPDEVGPLLDVLLARAGFEEWRFEALRDLKECVWTARRPLQPQTRAAGPPGRLTYCSGPGRP